jgi:hypothetical protein
VADNPEMLIVERAIEGLLELNTVNAAPLESVPFVETTVISPLVAPDGTDVEICDPLALTVAVAATPLKRT